jgi:hypothetical protein
LQNVELAQIFEPPPLIGVIVTYVGDDVPLSVMPLPPVPNVVAVTVTTAPEAAIVVPVCVMEFMAPAIFVASVVSESSVPVVVVTLKYVVPPVVQKCVIPVHPVCSDAPPVSVVPDHAKFVAVPFDIAIELPAVPNAVAVTVTVPPVEVAPTPTLLPTPALLISVVSAVASSVATPSTTNPSVGTYVITPVLGLSVTLPEVVVNVSLADVLVFVTVTTFDETVAVAVPLAVVPVP